MKTDTNREVIVVELADGIDHVLDAAVRALSAPPEAEDAWDAYSAQPLNYDASRLFREHDAFIAGWAARGEQA